MKKRIINILTLAALLSLGSFTMNAAGTPKNDVGGKIKRAVSLPEELKTPGFAQKVKVAFVMDAKGCVAQVAANTINLPLKQNIESQFKQLSLPELKAGTYNVEIDFIVY